MHIVDKLSHLPFFAPILAFQSYFYKIKSAKHDIISDLNLIASKSKELSEENDRFSHYLKTDQIQGLDQKVFELNHQISPLIDCQQCGNCCKTLMIVVTEEEAETVSTALEQSRLQFDQQYLEKGSSGLMIMNTMPCHFLKSNSCTIYTNRFEGCREFPALHLPRRAAVHWSGSNQSPSRSRQYAAGGSRCSVPPCGHEVRGLASPYTASPHAGEREAHTQRT